MAKQKRTRSARRPRDSASKRAVPVAVPNASAWSGRLIKTAGAVVVVSLVVFIALDPGNSGSGPPENVRQVALEEARHVEGPIDYGVAVPAGGPHNSVPLNCGFYDGRVPTENTVHSLEHGAAWVTYNSAARDDSDLMRQLRQVARDRRKVVVSEVPEQASRVMATAWGVQLELDTASDSRLTQFLNEYESASSAPEPGAACAGVGDPVG